MWHLAVREAHRRRISPSKSEGRNHIMLVKADVFFYCLPIWKIDVCPIGCFSGYVCEQDKKSLKPPPVVKCHHFLTPFEKLKPMSLHTSGVVYFMVFWGNTFRTNLTHWITMCSDTVDGSEIWLTGCYLPLRARLYLSQVVIAGFLNHQQ